MTLRNGFTHDGPGVARKINILIVVELPRREDGRDAHDGCAGTSLTKRGQQAGVRFGRRTAPENVKTYAPAFDVTPAELIAGIITDRGIISPVTADNVAAMIGQ